MCRHDPGIRPFYQHGCKVEDLIKFYDPQITRCVFVMWITTCLAFLFPAGGTSLSIALIWAISMRILKTWSHNVHDSKLLINRTRGFPNFLKRPKLWVVLEGPTTGPLTIITKLIWVLLSLWNFLPLRDHLRTIYIISNETARHEGKSFLA